MKRALLCAGFLLALLSMAGAANSLKPFERGSWQAILKAHGGRPTIVHFWGVTCGPCKVELPLLGAFMKKHPGIDMVTISADFVPNVPAAAQTMLDKSGLGPAENWIFDGFAERLRFEIDPNWQGEIPRTLLVAKDGSITTLEGTADISDLEKWSAAQGAAAR